MSGDFLTLEGVVVDCSHGTHTVSASVGGTTRSIKARRSGHLEMNRIKCLPGDRVVVEVSPYDLSRGRITRRLRDGEQFAQQEGA